MLRVEDDIPREEANVAVVSPVRYRLRRFKSSAASSIVGLVEGEFCVHSIPTSNSSLMATSHIFITSGDWSFRALINEESTISICLLKLLPNVSSVGFFLVTISRTNTPKLYTSPFVDVLDPNPYSALSGSFGCWLDESICFKSLQPIKQHIVERKTDADMIKTRYPPFVWQAGIPGICPQRCWLPRNDKFVAESKMPPLGITPSRSLDERFRNVRVWTLFKLVGIIPDKLFPDTSKTSRFLISPKDSGRCPSKLLADSLLSSIGKDPLSWLCERFRKIRSSRISDISGGMLPVSLLKERSTLYRPLHFPKLLGICPERSCKVSRVAPTLARELDNLPPRPILLSSSSANRLQFDRAVKNGSRSFPISDGMFPVRRLSEKSTLYSKIAKVLKERDLGWDDAKEMVVSELEDAKLREIRNEGREEADEVRGIEVDQHHAVMEPATAHTGEVADIIALIPALQP
nr:hypothetical protein DVH24_041572 [Ipomoea batatas]